MSSVDDWINFTRDVDYIAIFVISVLIFVVLIVVALIFIILIISIILVGTLVMLWVLEWTLLHFSDVSDSPVDQVVSTLLSLDLVAFFFIVWNVESCTLNSTSILLDPLLPLLWMFFAPLTLFLPCIHI